jgi:fatty acid desaturase
MYRDGLAATECTMALATGKAADSSAEMSNTRQIALEAESFLTRKIWLPRALYAILPLFYMGSGVIALLATLYISDWYWVLPHYVLFCAACVHLGVAVYRRRRRPDA